MTRLSTLCLGVLSLSVWGALRLLVAVCKFLSGLPQASLSEPIEAHQGLSPLSSLTSSLCLPYCGSRVFLERLSFGRSSLFRGILSPGYVGWTVGVSSLCPLLGPPRDPLNLFTIMGLFCVPP